MHKQEEVAAYYDKYTVRQKRIGVNNRHRSILKKCKSYGLKPTDKVLEIGCGVGTFSYLLLKFLKKGDLQAVDISKENIRIATEMLAQFNNKKLFAQDATDFLVKTKFDCIVLPDVLEHIPMNLHSKLFNHLDKMLSKNGFIFIHIPNPDYLNWCREHRPDLLQIIDQSIYPIDIANSINETNLNIDQLSNYKLWSENDYCFLVLKKKPSSKQEDRTIDTQQSLMERIKMRIQFF